MIIDFSVLIGNALGFSLAFAWNEAIIGYIRSQYPNVSDKSRAHEFLIYAIIITISVIIVVFIINILSSAAHFSKSRMVGGNIIKDTI
jgi:biotin transporter BioY